MFQILNVIDSVLGEHKQFGQGEYYYYCPLCHHHNPKLAVNIIKKKWHCWKCNASGNRLTSLLWKVGATKKQIQELAELLDDFVPPVAQGEEHQTSLRLPEEYKPLYIPSQDLMYRKALTYALQRGVTAQDIICYQVGYCSEGDYRGRLIIPSFSAEGTLNYFIGRTIYPNGLNYLTPQISKNVVGLENQINWKHPIIIVEGIFDAMAVKRNAVPLFGKHVSKKLQEKIITEGATDVYLALDSDALKDTIKIAERFIKQGINVYVVELNGKDPSSLGFAATQHLIQNAKKLGFSDLMELKLRLL